MMRASVFAFAFAYSAYLTEEAGHRRMR